MHPAADPLDDLDQLIASLRHDDVGAALAHAARLAHAGDDEFRDFVVTAMTAFRSAMQANVADYGIDRATHELEVVAHTTGDSPAVLAVELAAMRTPPSRTRPATPTEQPLHAFTVTRWLALLTLSYGIADTDVRAWINGSMQRVAELLPDRRDPLRLVKGDQR
ncbi:MAG TPA: hypothetical protein VHD87_15410 [Acidimicrobiales bacterium]|nr:hypothetical protein [Acidimicrobiales bacterium]